MILEETSYGIDDWNSDGLSFASKSQPYLPGKKHLLELRKDLGPATKLVCGAPERLLALHPKTGTLEEVDFQFGRSTIHEFSGVANTSDIGASVDRKHIYILDEVRNSVLQAHGTQPVRSWSIPLTLSPDSRLTVAIEANSDLVFFGPTACGRMCVLDPENPTGVIAFAVTNGSAGEPFAIRSGSHFWPDFRRRSLLITDSHNYRILEVDVSGVIDGYRQQQRAPHSPNAEILGFYGGTPLADGSSATQLVLASAGCVAVYRPEGFTLKKFLALQSKKFVEVDSSRVFPRTILVSDPANRRIVRIAEFGPASPWPTRVSTLIGSGGLPKDQVEEIKTAPDDDMRQWSITAPKNIALSRTGQLSILLQENLALVLTPISAIRANVEFAQAAEYGDGAS